MKAHILGNGPSIDLYTPQEGYIIGCNFQHHLVDVSVILDCKPFLVYKGNRSLLSNKKIITSKYAMKTIEEIKIKDEFEYVEILDGFELYESSGHIATTHAIKNNYDEIHLWGFNSIWEDNQETKSDLVIPRSTRQQFDLFDHWRKRWSNYRNYNIIVHNTTTGIQLKELL